MFLSRCHKDPKRKKKLIHMSHLFPLVNRLITLMDNKRVIGENFFPELALLTMHVVSKAFATLPADNGVYSSLFRAKASGGHSKTRETRDAQFLQKFTRFALIAVTSARPRVCKCPPPRIPVSQSPF